MHTHAWRWADRGDDRRDIVMAYIVMVYLLMFDLGLAHLVMACLGLAYLVMACLGLAYLVMACTDPEAKPVPIVECTRRFQRSFFLERPDCSS